MQKDKRFNELLMQHAMEETSEDFTEGVMNKIAALQTTKHNITSVLQSGLAKILIGAFAFVCIALLSVSTVMHPFKSGIHINILPSFYTMQFIYFLIAFWIVIFANQWWKKRNDNHSPVIQ